MDVKTIGNLEGIYDALTNKRHEKRSKKIRASTVNSVPGTFKRIEADITRHAMREPLHRIIFKRIICNLRYLSLTREGRYPDTKASKTS